MTPPPPLPSGPGARQRSGRRPGNTESRRTILDTARVAFGANGYAGTSLRGVAREAGVDPSLVVHFFGSKAGLFAAAIEATFDPGLLTRGITDTEPEAIGALIASTFLANWGEDERRFPLISLISAALTDETAAAVLGQFITANFSLPMVRRAGSDRPELRAALLSSQLMGFGLARYGLAFDALVEAPDGQLTDWLAETVQRTCTGPLPQARA